MEHYPGHLVMGVAALAATLLFSGVTVNRLVRRKLRLSIFLLGLYVAVNLVLAVEPELVSGATDAGRALAEQVRSLEQLAFAAAILNLLVVVIINPLRVDRVPDLFPSILQDAIVVGLLVIVATFVFEDRLLTTSAVGAVVVGFALQDTLGNAFAGLALQSEKPFRPGHWIRVGDFEGRVVEVTWRATKLRTKTGNFVILPNNVAGREAITNYSEPAVPTRLQLDVGASYLSTPGDVKAAILEALAQVPRVLQSPAPDALLHAFDSSAITYRARFWVNDYEFDEEAQDEVRTAIYYAFARRQIEIPWPIEVGYEREWPEPDEATKLRRREEVLADVDLFARLTPEQRRRVAASSAVRLFGSGEAIVRQGTHGESMFIVCSGTVAVRLEPSRREVATIGPGGYFGELSLLTGEPRTATVVASGDVSVLELGADVLRALGEADPQAVEQIGLAALTRRLELDQARETTTAAAVAAPAASIVERMKRFLGLR
ncbi:MAG TPA: mechanosensitive ion channel family protein [Vicinamibacterales bacterium]|nr:mechanosensitive ion channel family protein [Vicinamibacterales bacterium]